MLVLLSVLLLCQFSYLMLIISLPFTVWQIRLSAGVGGGEMGIFDPTKIIVRDNLRRKIKESLVYMGYHLLSFFVFMWQLVSLLSPESGGSKPGVHGEVPW